MKPPRVIWAVLFALLISLAGSAPTLISLRQINIGGTPSTATYLRGDGNWAAITASLATGNPTKADAQSSLFSRLVNGSIAGQQGFSLSGGATATVAGPVVSTVGNFNNQSDYVLSPREFSTGTLRFQMTAGSNGTFMLVWGLPATGNPAGNFAIWTAGGTSGSRVEFGWITYPGAAVTSAASLDGIIPSGRYTVEVVYRGQTAGAVTEVRVWGEAASRPSSPSFSYTFTGSEPTISGTRVGLRSIGNTAVPYQNLEVVDNVTLLRRAVLPSGYWFPLVYNGQTVLDTVNQGSRLDTVVQGSLNLTLNVIGHSGAAYQPKVAFKVDDGGWVYRTVPGSGAQALTVTLPDTNVHRVAVVASGIHETDAVWTQGQGLLVSGLTVDAGGQVSRPADDRPVLLIPGDSITAGIVAYGQNAQAPVSTPSQSAGELAYSSLLGTKLNMRTVVHGFGGTGFTVSGSGSVPKAATNVLNYQSTMPLYGEDVPNTVLINLGTNDGAQTDATVLSDALALTDALSARYPAARIELMRPVNGNKGSVVQQAATQRGLLYIDSTNWSGVTFADGTHPDPAGHNRVASLLAPSVVSPVGDMLKGAYDGNGNGVADNAEALGGTAAAAFPKLAAPNIFAVGNQFNQPLVLPQVLNYSTSFTQADGALPSEWTLGSSYYSTNSNPIKVAGNKAVPAATSGADTLMYLNLNTARDGTLQGTLTKGGELLFRYDPVAKVGYTLTLQSGSNTLQIDRQDTSSSTGLASFTTSATSNVYRVVLSGSTITVFEAGTQVLQTTDGTYSSGYVGIAAQSNGTASIDDFSFVPTATPAAAPNGAVLLSNENGILKTRNSAGQTVTVGEQESLRAITAATTVTSADDILVVSTSAGAITQPLPSAVGLTGKNLTFKKIDPSTNALTLSTVNSQTIDGQSTLALNTQNALVQLTSDGANWFVASLWTAGGRLDVYGGPSSSGTFTWTKPSWARSVTVTVIGSGGGGGSGRKGAAATARGGGSGGAGGGETTLTLSASILGSTETVSVGAGGIGGAAVTASSTNGNAGNVGNVSSFGNWVRIAGTPGGGNGGQAAAGSGSAGGVGMFSGGNSGGASITATGTSGTVAVVGAGGGGAGGSVSTADALLGGGTGATPALSQTVNNTPSAAGTSASVNGTNGSALASGHPFGGGGGAGGYPSISSTAAGSGGTGGWPGGGGGGGGAALDSTTPNSGAGGAGGNGAVYVYSMP